MSVAIRLIRNDLRVELRQIPNPSDSNRTESHRQTTDRHIGTDRHVDGHISIPLKERRSTAIQLNPFLFFGYFSIHFFLPCGDADEMIDVLVLCV